MRININYDTGSSFGTETGINELLEYDFNTEELAKEAMQRIEEHYKWYCNKTSSYTWRAKEMKKPEWHKIKTVDIKDSHNMINLNVWSEKDNKVVEVEFWPFWIGYFESLNYVEIIGERITI